MFPHPKLRPIQSSVRTILVYLPHWKGSSHTNPKPLDMICKKRERGQGLCSLYNLMSTEHFSGITKLIFWKWPCLRCLAVSGPLCGSALIYTQLLHFREPKRLTEEFHFDKERLDLCPPWISLMNLGSLWQITLLLGKSDTFYLTGVSEIKGKQIHIRFFVF